jgi:hypothetical protein
MDFDELNDKRLPPKFYFNFFHFIIAIYISQSSIKDQYVGLLLQVSSIILNIDYFDRYDSVPILNNI